MTVRWKKKAQLYKLFDLHLNIQKDYSPEAAQAMYEYESTGKGNLSPTVFSDGKVNGYAYGKYWMDWQINAWRQGIKDGLTSVEELINGIHGKHPEPGLKEKYPEEWLRKVLA